MILYLGLVGLTLILTRGTIFDKVRNWIGIQNGFLGTLVYCSQCLGFWVGLVYYVIRIRKNVIEAILFASAISLLSYLIDAILERLEHGM